jgi:hypothetical protein
LSLCFPLCLSLSVSPFSSSVTPPSVSSAVHPASVVSSTLLSPLSPCHLFSPYFHMSSILASISSSTSPLNSLSMFSALSFPSLSPLLTLGLCLSPSIFGLLILRSCLFPSVSFPLTLLEFRRKM